MELVVTGHLLDQLANLATFLEQHAVVQVVQQHGRRQRAAHQGLQFLERPQRVERDAVNGAPAHEALAVGRQRAHQRAHQRRAAVRDHQQLVVLEQVGQLRLVGLDLVVNLPDVGVEVGRVLQLDQHQRQAVDEQQQVGPAAVARPLDGELVDVQPVVGGGVGPVDQASEVAAAVAALLLLHRHARHQEAVKLLVGRQQGRRAQVDHLLECVVTGGGG
jgi:hypothetical protein